MSRRYNGLDFARKPKKKISAEVIREAVSWCFWLVISAIIAVALMYVFGLRTNVIGNSMEPSLYSDQQILIDRMIYNVSAPKRYDVVAFLPNGNENSHFYIKRVIGIPGDTVQIIDGFIYVDNCKLEEANAFDKIADAGILDNAVTLKEDEYILLGDNRNFSEDSRSGNIGIVKKEYMIGKVWFRLSPNLQFLGLVR